MLRQHIQQLIDIAYYQRSEFNMNEAIGNEIAAICNMIEIETPETSLVSMPVIRKPGNESWRPNLNPIDINTAELTRSDKKLVKVIKTRTRRDIGQFKIAAIQEWDFVQAGRALAQYDYWHFEHSFTRNGVTWNVAQHRYEDKKFAVCLDGSNFFVMTKQGKHPWQVHIMTAPGLHATKAAGWFWVYGDTRKHASQLAQAGGMFKANSPIGMPAWGFYALPDQIAAILTPNRWNKYHLLAAMLIGDRVVIQSSGFSVLAGEVEVLDGYRRELWRVAGYDYRDYPRPVFGVVCHACGEIKNGFVRDICCECDADLNAHLEREAQAELSAQSQL